MCLTDLPSGLCIKINAGSVRTNNRYLISNAHSGAATRGRSDLLFQIRSRMLCNIYIRSKVSRRILTRQVAYRSCLFYQRRLFRTFMNRTGLTYLLYRRLINSANMKVLFLCRHKGARRTHRFRHEAANVTACASNCLQTRLLSSTPYFPLTSCRFRRCKRILPRVFTIRSNGKWACGPMANV